ncbi:hypothetical protein [uncultured Christiangramia sp.]|uniref:hypothetical protein n=1 Tax=uncultured Christiangramia sp. TaxID=503836 RepID=UPI0026211BEE|nr:hypothetical protein [uncultured Christiangramia sp.]
MAAFAFFTSSSFAQIEVHENEPKEEIGKVKVLFDTTLESSRRGDMYTIMYQDTKFQHIKEFKSFSLTEESFNQIYDLIQDNWDNPPKEDLMIELQSGELLWLHFTKALGVTNLQLHHSPDGNADVIGVSMPLNQKKIDKLFGK